MKGSQRGEHNNGAMSRSIMASFIIASLASSKYWHAIPPIATERAFLAQDGFSSTSKGKQSPAAIARIPS
jgi:hypothetical protein